MSKEYTYAGLSKEAKAIVDGMKESCLSSMAYINHLTRIAAFFTDWEYNSNKQSDLRTMIDEIPHVASEQIDNAITKMYTTRKALNEAIDFFYNARRIEIKKALTK